MNLLSAKYLKITNSFGMGFAPLIGMIRIFFIRFLWILTLMVGQALSFANEAEGLKGTTMEARTLGLLTYSEDLGAWQRELADLYESMAEYSRNSGGAISARHLSVLRSKVEEFHSYHLPRLTKFNSSEHNFLEHGIILKLTKKKTKISQVLRHTPLLQARIRERGAIRFKGTIVPQFEINPSDKLGRELLIELKFQFVSKVLLLESYTLGLSPFIETKAFRGVLLRDLVNDETTETLESLWFESMEALFKRELLIDRLSFIQRADEEGHENDKSHEALDFIIENSVVVSELEKRKDSFSLFRDMAKNMSFMAKRRWDTYRQMGVSVLYEGSKIFGNTVGLVQSRKGYLYSWSDEEENEVSRKLRSLDILFEKTPFRLTDRFIPGHFGHVAIWTGNERELKEIGVWNELSAEHQQGVREGRRIIEALRPGVQFNTFRHFLDIDDLAAFRIRNCEEGENSKPNPNEDIICLNRELKREYLLKAFAQIGKDYDFAFDVNTEETIVCSELVYRSFLDISFETTNTVGMYNISPDQVAKKGDDEGELLTPLFLYHKGNLVEEKGEGLRAFIKNLMFPEER